MNGYNVNSEEVLDPYSSAHEKPLNAYQQDSFSISNLLQSQYLSNQINSVNSNSASQTISADFYSRNDIDIEQEIDPPDYHQTVFHARYNDSTITNNMTIEAQSYSNTNQNTSGNNSLNENYIHYNSTTLSIPSALPEQELINPNLPQGNEGNIGLNTQSTAISEANSTISDHKYLRSKNRTKFIWTRLRAIFRILQKANLIKTQHENYRKLLKSLEIEEKEEQKKKNILKPKTKYIGLFSSSVKTSLYGLDLSLSMKIREQFTMYLQTNIHVVYKSFKRSKAKKAIEYYEHFINELGQA